MAGAVGIFGGTFDPIHRGHVETAKELTELLDFEVVHFIPNGTPSHRDGPVASAAHRFEMVELALAESEKFFADDREIRRGGLSYTVDTLLALRKQYGPDRPLVLILGADAFLGLPTWNRWRSVFDLVHVVVMNRPGSPLTEPGEDQQWWLKRRNSEILDCATTPKGSIFEVSLTPVDVSSTHIRDQLKAGIDAGADLAAPVLRYIVQQSLYQTGQTALAESGAAALLKNIEVGLEDAKARDIKTLDVRGLTDFTDYMVIASGTSDVHVRAVAQSVTQQTGEFGVQPGSREGEDTADWILLDFGAAVVHVMKQSSREFYDLESLWSEELKVLVAKNRENGGEL